MARVPATTAAEVAPFAAALAAVPKAGLHNAFKRPDRYVHYGAVTARAAAALAQPDTHAFFARLVQRTSPKSTPQAEAEVTVTRRFLENFAGDAVRFTAAGFTVPGDHAGQASTGHRWPYGGVGLVTPFNFPIEIPALQALGALFMGNRPLIHVDARVAVVFEQFLRLLHACGADPGDADLLHAVDGAVVEKALVEGRARSTLFTGSRAVAERLSASLGGRVFLEDAGFDWKVLGPDGPADEAHLAHAAWVADQDAYACSGQKCSAQSMLFMHSSWADAGLEACLAARAGARKLADLTIGPVLTWSTDRLLEHVGKCVDLEKGERGGAGARTSKGGPLVSPRPSPLEPLSHFSPLL
jgi:1-pyrroline-5-carboxylate dehydrogenase